MILQTFPNLQDSVCWKIMLHLLISFVSPAVYFSFYTLWVTSFHKGKFTILHCHILNKLFLALSAHSAFILAYQIDHSCCMICADKIKLTLYSFLQTLSLFQITWKYLPWPIWMLIKHIRFSLWKHEAVHFAFPPYSFKIFAYLSKLTFLSFTQHHSFPLNNNCIHIIITHNLTILFS